MLIWKKLSADCAMFEKSELFSLEAEVVHPNTSIK